MFEVLQHMFGLCSDSSMHPNIIMLLSGGFGFRFLWQYIKFRKNNHEYSENCNHKKNI